jgi:hypothetical protein
LPNEKGQDECRDRELEQEDEPMLHLRAQLIGAGNLSTSLVVAQQHDRVDVIVTSQQAQDLIGTFEMILASQVADAIGIVAQGRERRARDGRCLRVEGLLEL